MVARAERGGCCAASDNAGIRQLVQPRGLKKARRSPRSPSGTSADVALRACGRYGPRGRSSAWARRGPRGTGRAGRACSEVNLS